MDHVKFLSEEIDVAAGRYARWQLMAMAVDGAGSVGASPTEPSPSANDDLLTPTADETTWAGKEAPRGKPSLAHVFEVMAWMRGNPKRNDAFLAALFSGGKNPKLKKTCGDLGEVVGKMPVFDSARWLFATMREHVSPRALHEAYAEINDEPLRTELREWGLTDDGVRDGSRAWEQVQAHTFMPAILSGAREDGVYKIAGSAARVMKALKTVFDALPEEHRARMHDHIVKNYDADKDKAMAPLLKVLGAKGFEDVGVLLQTLMARGDVPVAVLAMVFQDTWDRLYTKLTACLDTVGPTPPWIKPASA